MQQVELPFEAQFKPGWVGYRYLRCDDGQWHLVLSISSNGAADTQCCANVVLDEHPTEDASQYPMCEDCTALQFPVKSKEGR